MRRLIAEACRQKAQAFRQGPGGPSQVAVGDSMGRATGKCRCWPFGVMAEGQVGLFFISAPPHGRPGCGQPLALASSVSRRPVCQIGLASLAAWRDTLRLLSRQVAEHFHMINSWAVSVNVDRRAPWAPTYPWPQERVVPVGAISPGHDGIRGRIRRACLAGACNPSFGPAGPFPVPELDQNILGRRRFAHRTDHAFK